MAKSSPLSGRIGPRFGGRGARKSRKIIIASLVIIAAGSMATTLAANVTINGNYGQSLEFGQGQVPAIACDQSITTAVTEDWDNYTGLFHVNTIVLSHLDVRPANLEVTYDPNNQPLSDQGCGGKTLNVGLLNVDGTKLFMGYDQVTEGVATQLSFVVPSSAGSASSILPSGASVVFYGDTDKTNYSATITLPGLADTRAAASDVYRVTLETD
jgi:hypothetical protein